MVLLKDCLLFSQREAAAADLQMTGSSSDVLLQRWKEEDRVYSLLFGECDKKRTGLVEVDELVKYIGRMQLQVSQSEGVESTDAQDSVSFSLSPT